MGRGGSGLGGSGRGGGGAKAKSAIRFGKKSFYI